MSSLVNRRSYLEPAPSAGKPWAARPSPSLELRGEVLVRTRNPGPGAVVVSAKNLGPAGPWEAEYTVVEL